MANRPIPFPDEALSEIRAFLPFDEAGRLQDVSSDFYEHFAKRCYRQLAKADEDVVAGLAEEIAASINQGREFVPNKAVINMLISQSRREISTSAADLALDLSPPAIMSMWSRRVQSKVMKMSAWEVAVAQRQMAACYTAKTFLENGLDSL